MEARFENLAMDGGGTTNDKSQSGWTGPQSSAWCVTCPYQFRLLEQDLLARWRQKSSADEKHVQRIEPDSSCGPCYAQSPAPTSLRSPVFLCPRLDVLMQSLWKDVIAGTP